MGYVIGYYVRIMMDEVLATLIGVVVALLVVVVGILAFTFTAHQNNLKDQKFMGDCLDKGGSVAYDDEYKLKCILPSNRK